MNPDEFEQLFNALVVAVKHEFVERRTWPGGLIHRTLLDAVARDIIPAYVQDVETGILIMEYLISHEGIEPWPGYNPAKPDLAANETPLTHVQHHIAFAFDDYFEAKWPKIHQEDADRAADADALEYGPT